MIMKLKEARAHGGCKASEKKWMDASLGCFTREDRLPTVHWVGLRTSLDGLATGKMPALYNN
jgi:hypothetical protein